jgi:lysophospholipid acyltransferase (LPLAT)-like uncharacterized protein
MSITKRILKHHATQSFASLLFASYIRFVMLTSKKTFEIHPDAAKYMRGEENALFAFWHGRMMLMPAINPPRTMHVLSSSHRDGQLISKVTHRFNLKTIIGSSSKGGSEAARNIVRLLKKGDNISITPDGPRGPIQQAEMGIVTLARLSHKVILPITFSAKKHKRLRSWDKFMIAKPFGSIIFCIGEPIVIKEANEESRLIVEKAMNELVEHADRLQNI